MAAAAAGPYQGFKATRLRPATSNATVLLTSFIDPFTNAQKTQFRDASLTLAGDNYPKNTEMSCDLPLYFSEKYNREGEAEETVGGITWVRTVKLQDYVMKTDDGKMLTSWTTAYPDLTQQPEGVDQEFTEHKAALEGFDNSSLMMINCDFLTNNAGMLETHLKLFHNIIFKQVGGGSSGNSVSSALAGAPTSFRLIQSNDIPPPKLPHNPSKLTIKQCKADYKYHAE